MSKFEINNEVIFDAETRRLVLSSNGESVQLYSTGANCLSLLIENHGRLIPKEEIFDKVWRDHGMFISDNTYYQTILHLRKSFKLLGAKKSYIQTVPRKGILIPASISIKKMFDDDVIQRTEYRDTEESQEDSTRAEMEICQMDGVDISGAVVKKENKNMLMKKTYFAVFFAVCFISLLSFVYKKNAVYEHVRFNWLDYKFTQNIGDCHIYSNSSYPAEGQNLENDIGNIMPLCKKYSYVYVTKEPGIKRISSFICHDSFDSQKNENQCVSFYHITG